MVDEIRTHNNRNHKSDKPKEPAQSIIHKLILILTHFSFLSFFTHQCPTIYFFTNHLTDNGDNHYYPFIRPYPRLGAIIVGR
ncbi:hypothetical protein SAMN05421882_10183 [Nitrosomonas communis]|uniref:Uncharacterized protein n=1 Tax=Nitrosomonas communis TaxID=44574 RepID=A0A1H2UU84_9PROT|nr:hypothetical protein SAMN05421882_10183 [Nitrosomonas communis]